MRGQSEAIGLAIIIALVIGSIIAYAVLQDEPVENNDGDRIIAENFVYVLLSSDYETPCGPQRVWRLLENALDRRDPCNVGASTLTETQVEAAIADVIESVTSESIDRWGYRYDLTLTNRSGGTPYERTVCGFERSGVASQTLRRTGATMTFALCS